jgi:hypothetical protein
MRDYLDTLILRSLGRGEFLAPRRAPVFAPSIASRIQATYQPAEVQNQENVISVTEAVGTKPPAPGSPLQEPVEVRERDREVRYHGEKTMISVSAPLLKKSDTRYANRLERLDLGAGVHPNEKDRETETIIRAPDRKALSIEAIHADLPPRSGPDVSPPIKTDEDRTITESKGREDTVSGRAESAPARTKVTVLKMAEGTDRTAAPETIDHRCFAGAVENTSKPRQSTLASVSLKSSVIAGEPLGSRHDLRHPAPPAIHVTIGRIEVRATAPAPVPVREPPPAKVNALDEYLRRRKGGNT